MKINDRVFGELEYDYIWSKEMVIKFLESECEVVLMINGDEDAEFEEEQYIAYNCLMKKWSNLQDVILEAILNYYNEIRSKLGYDIEEDKRYPVINTIDELTKNITLVGIVIPYSGNYEGKEYGLTFDCKWDEENGIGVLFVDEDVTKVGYQDSVM